MGVKDIVRERIKLNAGADCMIINFDKEKFKIKELIFENIFENIRKKIPGSEFKLENLHAYISPEEKPLVLNGVYSLFRKKNFQEQYDQLCRTFIKEFNTIETRFQSIPSVRIQLPGDISVDFHADMFYGHGPNIINYWMPITSVFETNSMHVLSERDSKSVIDDAKKSKRSIKEINKKCEALSRALNLKYGEVYKFHSNLLHGTLTNQTDKTRVSIDFRMVEGNDSTGLKDNSFFIKNRDTVNASEKQKKRRAMLYFNREGKEDILPSQKYQQLSSLEFCEEKNLIPVRLETELSGFDYFPALFHIIICSREEKFNDLVIYSKHNLPGSKTFIDNFRRLCADYKIMVHYVLEDIFEQF